MAAVIVNNMEKPRENNDGPQVYVYSAWQPSPNFEIALESRNVSYAEKGFVLTAEALDSQGNPIAGINANWPLAARFAIPFCYLPPTKTVGLVPMPPLSFDAPVQRLRIMLRPWLDKTSSPATLFGEVIIRTYYSSDSSDQKIGSHLGRAVRQELKA